MYKMFFKKNKKNDLWELKKDIYNHLFGAGGMLIDEDDRFYVRPAAER